MAGIVATDIRPDGTFGTDGHSTYWLGLSAANGTTLDIGGELVDFPIGARRVDFQPRKAGDVYVEIDGTYAVSAVGTNPVVAARAAVSAFIARAA